MLTMNGKERFFQTLSHGKADRIPVMPYIGNWGAKLAGCPLGEYHTNGKKMAAAHLQAYERHGLDLVNPQSDNYYIAEGLGVQVEIQEDATPVVVKVPLTSLRDVEKLRVPDSYTDGRMPVYLEAIQLLHDQVGSEAVVRAPGTGSFSLAGHLMGVDRFIMEIATAEAEEDESAQQYIFDLMEICTESLIAFATATVKCGASLVMSGDSLASINMISPAIYRKYAYPYEVKFFRAMKELQKSYPFAALLHVCGNNNPVAADMMSTGCDILEVDYACDLRHYKELSTEKNVCIMGNLNPAGNLMRGTPEAVYREATDALRTAGGDGFFILGSGCEVAVSTPLENIRAMVRASEDFARA